MLISHFDLRCTFSSTFWPQTRGWLNHCTTTSCRWCTGSRGTSRVRGSRLGVSVILWILALIRPSSLQLPLIRHTPCKCPIMPHGLPCLSSPCARGREYLNIEQICTSKCKYCQTSRILELTEITVLLLLC